MLDFDWDYLLSSIAERRVIPVIGKELCRVEFRQEGKTLERFLAERLADALGVPVGRLRDSFDMNVVAMAYLREGGDRRKIYSRLKAVLDELQYPVSEALKKLAAITDFALYVSVTFDPLLRRAIDEQRFGGESNTACLAYSMSRRIEDLPARLAQLSVPHVYHLFGQVSSTPDYAVTDEDFLEFVHSLQSEFKRPELLFEEFRTNHLLFIGCGFENWFARFLFRTIRNQRLLIPRDASELVADQHVRQDENLTVFLQQFRTEIYLEGSPVEFVDELFCRWRNQRPSPQPLGTRMESGAVFLSYARQDMEAVRNMKQALEGAGLEVWFDQSPEDLQPGSTWDREIRLNIRRSAVFIPIVSRHAQRRLEGYFRREWNWAIERDQGMDPSLRFIQPVVVDDTPEGTEGIPEHFWSRQVSRFLGGVPRAEFIEQLRGLLRRARMQVAGA